MVIRSTGHDDHDHHKEAFEGDHDADELHPWWCLRLSHAHMLAIYLGDHYVGHIVNVVIWWSSKWGGIWGWLWCWWTESGLLTDWLGLLTDTFWNFSRLYFLPLLLILHFPVFRKRSPYKWEGKGNIVQRNSVRLAEVATRSSSHSLTFWW